jgi:peptidyl-prolyl cis-trans isomerase SurA
MPAKIRAFESSPVRDASQERFVNERDHRPLARFGEALALLCCVGLVAVPAHAQEQLIDGVAAQVGSNVVLVSEVDTLTRGVVERMRAANIPESEIAGVRKDALERLIEQRLVDEVVVQLELGATPDEVDNAIEGIAAETGLTLKQLAQSVAGYGMSFDDYRDKIRSEIERNKVLNAMVRSRVQVSPEEIEALFNQQFGDQRSEGEEFHIGHILVRFGGETGRDHATACATTTEVRRQILEDGLSFGDAAREVSDANAETAGDLGWIHEEEMASWMTRAIGDLGNGENLTDVIDMPFGCNLLEVTERREFRALTLDEARPSLENQLFRQKTEQEYIRWLAGLREQAYIERRGIYASSFPGSQPSASP